MKQLNLEDFAKLYQPFIQHETWTKEKRSASEEVWSYLSKHESVKIIRKAGIYELYYLNQFTIIKVHSNKTGKLKPFRNKLVLIIATYRFGYNFHINCYPLKNKFVQPHLMKMIKNMGDVYVASPDEILENQGNPSASK